VKIRSHGTRSFVRAEPLERRVLFAAGDLDTTFGGGDGVADTDLAGRVAAITFTDDGSIVVVGSTPRDDEGSIVVVGSPPPGGQELALVRYTPDGRLDTRFAAGGDDGDGRIVVPRLGYDLPGLSKIDPQGRIVVTLAGGSPDLRVLRFNADGTRDMGFGENGVAGAHFGHGASATVLRFQDDGKILVGVRASGAPAPGSEDYDASARFNPDGSTDLTYGAPYGPGGVPIFVPPDDTGRDRIEPYNVHLPDPFAPGASKGATAKSPAIAAAMQADGKIVALDISAPDGTEHQSHAAVLRFNADGTLDPTFAHGVHDADHAAPYTIAVQPVTGRILYTKGDAGTHFDVVGLASSPPLETPRVVPPADATGPTATVISVPHVTAPTTSAVTFTVRYEDDAGVLDSSFDDFDIIVKPLVETPRTGRGDWAHVVSVADAGGTARDVTYAVPYEHFTADLNGTYRLWLTSASVFDINGNAAHSQENMGAFSVDIPADAPAGPPDVPVDVPDPMPVDDTPGPNLTAGPVTARLRKGGTAVPGRRPAGRASFVVSNAGTLPARGRVRVILMASTDGTLDAADVPVAVRLRGLSLRPGQGRSVALRLGRIPPAMAAGSYFLLARVDSMGRLTETTAQDNVGPQSNATIHVVAAPGGAATTSGSRRRPGNDLAAAAPVLPS
jgi:uncharacterized delta-60 repeat protein